MVTAATVGRRAAEAPVVVSTAVVADSKTAGQQCKTMMATTGDKNYDAGQASCILEDNGDWNSKDNYNTSHLTWGGSRNGGVRVSGGGSGVSGGSGSGGGGNVGGSGNGRQNTNTINNKRHRERQKRWSWLRREQGQQWWPCRRWWEQVAAEMAVGKRQEESGLLGGIWGFTCADFCNCKSDCSICVSIGFPAMFGRWK